MSSKPLQIKTINPDNVYGESVIYSQPIVSDTQPTIESLGTQLWEGLIWYNPTLNVTKMYINGEFLQINIAGGIDASYYASGDSYAITKSTPVSGFIGDGKSIFFTVFTTKSLKNISSCSISIFTGNLRGINGVINGSTTTVTYASSSDYTLSATKVSDNAIRIILTKTTAFTNSTADTPVVFHGQLTINFS